MSAPRGATPPLISRLMGTSPFPKVTYKRLGWNSARRAWDQRVDEPGWQVSTWWADRRFVLLNFEYWMDNCWDTGREEAALGVLCHMARWIADQGFVVYLVPDRDRVGIVRHPYALVGRIGNEPRDWSSPGDADQAERLDPQEAA